MTQLEVGTFHFKHKGGNGGVNYIDLTKSDTIANCKNKQQFKNGRPLAYVITARFSNAGNEILTIPTGWVQTNALVKTAAAWRKMYKKAGLSKRDLNTYGRELRLPISKTHRDNWAKSSIDLLAEGLEGSYQTEQYDKDGNTIHVITSVPDPSTAPVGQTYEHAFDLTKITIPDPDGSRPDAIDWSPFVLANGTSLADITSCVINQYCLSRGSVDQEDTDLDLGEAVVSQNYLIQALSDNEETSDDVMDNVKDLGDFRPYEIGSQIQVRTRSVASETNVAGQDTSFIAPLGLMEWSGSVDDVLTLTVSAIVEM